MDTTTTATTTPYDDRGRPSLKAIKLGIRSLVAYHQHRVVGLENIPLEGPAIVVANHSLATYDTMMLAPHVADERGRELLALVDRLAMRAPITRTLFKYTAIVGTREGMTRALNEGKIILVMPGGTREMLRDSRRKYQIDWTGRRGFVRISMQTGVPIILAACPRADDIFKVYPNPVTPRVYSRFRVPLPVFRGLGPSLIPRPIRLQHLLSEPIVPDVAPARFTDADVDAHHERLVTRMRQLMSEALLL